jgi:hypothetical protein
MKIRNNILLYPLTAVLVTVIIISSCENNTTVKKVSLNKSSITLAIGEYEQLETTIEPSDADNLNVSWISSDNDIATVTSSGLVTGLSEGTASVTVITEDGGHSATCEVTVYDDRVYVTGVWIDKSKVTLMTGETAQLYVTIQPWDADNKNVSWSTSDEGVATVSSSGQVTAVGEGTAEITVETEDGGYTDICEVTVQSPYKVAHFSITDGGTVAWSIQFSQDVEPIIEGVIYEINFDAWASKDVQIYCDLNQAGGNYEGALLSDYVSPMFDITTSTMTFTRYAMSRIDDDAGDYSQLQFNLGNLGPYDFYLTNVSLTADGVEQIINGDFSLAITEGWNSLLLMEGGEGTVSIEAQPPQ